MSIFCFGTSSKRRKNLQREMEDLYSDALYEVHWSPPQSMLVEYYDRIIKHAINHQKSKTMESVKVTPPEGYEIDKEKSTTSEIFFRKKDDRPRKWSDLGDALGYEIHPTHLGTGAFGAHYRYDINQRRYNTGGTIGKSLWPTKELAEAALALSELMQYRQRWIGDWKPDWKSVTFDKYTIKNIRNELFQDLVTTWYSVLSFPTEEMRDDFLNTFKDLLETAKPLL